MDKLCRATSGPVLQSSFSPVAASQGQCPKLVSADLQVVPLLLHADQPLSSCLLGPAASRQDANKQDITK